MICTGYLQCFLVFHNCLLGEFYQSIIRSYLYIGQSFFGLSFYIGLRGSKNCVRLRNTKTILEGIMAEVKEMMKRILRVFGAKTDRVGNLYKKQSRSKLHRGQFRTMVKWDQSPVILYK
jgi:hypothetical protein